MHWEKSLDSVDRCVKKRSEKRIHIHVFQYHSHARLLSSRVFHAVQTLTSVCDKASYIELAAIPN